MAKTDFFIFLLNLVNLFGPSFQDTGVQLPRKGCDHTVRVLNDCNWCTCNKLRQFTCATRDCSMVDKFGHFNDAIKDINVGMEGHGYWRTREPSCEPNVHYAKNKLLCVCTEEGNWPSTVCDETFRVLHPVLVTALSEPSASQSCTPSTLYLVGCNVCFCPTSGSIDPELCTKRACSLDDPVVKQRSELLEGQVEAEEIYAECDAESSYSLGCRSCKCLRNNRLECNQCENVSQAECSGRNPGESFKVDCNYCMCNEQGRSFCTMMNCAASGKRIVEEEKPAVVDLLPVRLSAEGQCPKGHSFKLDCNYCFCLNNGNALCTTVQCRKRKWALD